MILRPSTSGSRRRREAAPTEASPGHAEGIDRQRNQLLNPQDDYRDLLDYITRWRWALKVASRGAGGRKGLMNLSLLRMDALIAELSHTPSPGDTSESIL
jgi:hypothetical protein